MKENLLFRRSMWKYWFFEKGLNCVIGFLVTTITRFRLRLCFLKIIIEKKKLEEKEDVEQGSQYRTIPVFRLGLGTGTVWYTERDTQVCRAVYPGAPSNVALLQCYSALGPVRTAHTGRYSSVLQTLVWRKDDHLKNLPDETMVELNVAAQL